MSEQEPGPTHTPYGQSSPHGQPSPYGQSSPYGQQPAYGMAPQTGDRRPGTVTAAAWITIVFSAITAALFGLAGLALLVARDQVITEMERVPEFQDANIDADAAVGVLVVILLGIVVWCLIAIVLGVLVLRRSNVARILLVISASVTALLSLIGIASGVSVVPLIAAIATIVLLFVGGAGDWFKRVGTPSGGYPGASTGYPGGQYGTPYAGQPGQDASQGYPSADNPYGRPVRPGPLRPGAAAGRRQPLRPAAAHRGWHRVPAAGLPEPLTGGPAREVSVRGRRQRDVVRRR